MSQIVEHFAAILISWIDMQSGKREFAFTPKFAAQTLLSAYALDLGPQRLKGALELLVEVGCAQRVHSPLTDDFYRVSVDQMNQRFGLGVWTKQGSDTVPKLEGADEKYPILHALLVGGREWADFVISEMRQNEQIWRTDGSYINNITIPASDRIVTLSHNQSVEMTKPTEELIATIEADNGLADEPGFRERILGQLRAGRELLKAGIFEFQIFHMTMIIGLKMLIEKYRGHAIGAMASKLLDLIIHKVGEFF